MGGEGVEVLEQDILWSVRVAGGNTVEGKRRSELVEALVVAIEQKQAGKKRKQAGFPTPTEYYVAALSALATHLSSDAATDPIINGDLLYVLSKILPHVPVAVVRLDSDAAFASIIAATGKTANLGVRSGLSALGTLLAAQGKETWGRPVVVKAFRGLLSKLVDDNPKVRKAAHEACLRVLSEGHAKSAAAQLFLETMGTMTNSRAIGERNQLRFLHFARLAAPYLIKRQHRTEAREALMSLIESATSTEVITQSLQALLALFARTDDEGEAMTGEESAEDKANAETTGEFMSRLIKCFRFSKFPVQPWAEALAGLAVRSNSHETAVAAILQVIREERLSEAVLSGLCGSLMKIVTSERLTAEEAVLSCEGLVSSGLHPQVQGAWHLLVPTLSALVERHLRPQEEDTHDRVIKTIVVRAVECRESLVDVKSGEEVNDAPWTKQMEHLIGVCASKLGPDVFFTYVPLHMSKEDQNLNPARLCLFRVLREAWRNPENDLVKLNTFRQLILRLAKFAEDAASKAQAEGMPQHAKVYRMRSTQLWSLLPAFCSGASDLHEALPPLAKILVGALQDTKTPELGVYVAQGLSAAVRSCVGFSVIDKEKINEAELVHSKFGATVKSMAKSRMDFDDDDDDDEDDDEKDDEDDAAMLRTGARDDEDGGEVQRRIRSEEEEERDLAVLRKAATHFMLVLFNEFDAACRAGANGATRAQHFLGAIESLARVAERGYLTTLFKQLLQKLLTALNGEDNQTSKVLLGLSAAISQGLGPDEATILVRALKPHLVEAESNDEGLQKRAFVCFSRILKASQLKEWVEESREELFDILQQSLVAPVKSSVKCARLQCLRRLLHGSFALRDLSNELMGEIVLSLKESNSQTRAAGFDLFTEMAETMYLEEKAVDDFFQMTVAGLAATTPHMRACTILAICRLVALFGSLADVAPICAEAAVTCFPLFAEKSREVARSLITLSKVCAIKLDPELLQEKVLTPLLRGILPWSLDTKNRFASKIRVVFDKLVKRLSLETIVATGVVPQDHRLLMYIKKQQSLKRKRRERANSEASDARDDNDGEGVEIAQRGSDPVNLLDPSSLANIKRLKRTRNNDEEDDEEIRVDSEGRFIIPSDIEEEDENSLKKKRRMGLTEDKESDSDDEEEAAAAAAEEAKGKRKKRKPEQQFGKEFKARKAGGDAKYKGTNMDPYAYIPLDHHMLNKRKKHQAVRRFVGVGKGSRRRAPSRGGDA